MKIDYDNSAEEILAQLMDAIEQSKKFMPEKQAETQVRVSKPGEVE